MALSAVANAVAPSVPFLPVAMAQVGKVLDAETLKHEALEWSKTRGSRSGRVAWQYIQNLAGRLGKPVGTDVRAA